MGMIRFDSIVSPSGEQLRTRCAIHRHLHQYGTLL